MGCGASASGEAEFKFQPSDVDRAVTLSRSGIVANQRKAISTILSIASAPDDKWRVRLVDSGCLDSLIAMLRSNSKTVQLSAAKAVAKIATAASVRPKIMQEGTIPPLCDLFKDASIKSKLTAMEALHQIAMYEESRPKVVAEGVTAQSLVLFEQENLEIELAVLAFISRLSQHQRSHLRMGKDGIITVLCEVIKNPLKSVKHKRHAITAIAELCTHIENHKLIAHIEYKDKAGHIVKLNGLSLLVSMTSYYADDIKTFAAVAVARLAENCLLRSPLVAIPGCIENLIAMMKVPKVAMQRNATGAICALALDPLNQVRIIKAGALAPLVKLARCGNDAIEASASMAIAVLASNNINRPKMLAHGAFKPLVYAARFGHTAEIKRASLTVLASLFHTDAFRKKEMIRRACDRFKALLQRRKQSKGVAVRTYQAPKDNMGQDDGDDGASQVSSDDDF